MERLGEILAARHGKGDEVEILEELLDDYCHDGGAEPRFREVMEALADVGGSKAVPVIIFGLNRGIYKRYAARALGRVGSQEAVEALIKALESWDVRLRKESIKALALIGRPQGSSGNQKRRLKTGMYLLGKRPLWPCIELGKKSGNLIDRNHDY